MQSPFQLLLVGDRSEGDGKGNETVLRLARIAAERRRRATRTNHLDISRSVAREGDAVLEDRDDLLAIAWQPHAQTFDPAEEAIEMQIETKESPIPHMHRIVGRV